MKNGVNLSAHDREIISANLHAFLHNFGEVRIEKVTGYGFYVYYPANSDSYIQFCNNVHYLDGWLYGVVQGFVRGEFKRGYQFSD